MPIPVVGIGGMCRNQQGSKMNGYLAFYNDKQVEIHADSLYEAKVKALAYFHPPKSKQHMVHVHLAELGGKQVVHTADF
mgnify:CR=1 FL=1